MRSGRIGSLAVVGVLACCAGVAASGAERVHIVPYVPSAAHGGFAGLVRIENRSARSGEVRVLAIDDGGRGHEAGPVRLAASGTVQFGSDDLETGNAELGLAGTGAGSGDWRLEVRTDLDIEARAYGVLDGFAAVLDDVASAGDAGYRVTVFNPGSNPERESLLRLVNVGVGVAAVTVRGRDDTGAAGGEVRLELAAGGARTYASRELETGRGAGLEGPGLGDGTGKWRLRVESDGELVVQHLMRGRNGALWSVPSAWTRGAGTHRVALFPSAVDGAGREGVLRLVNRSPEPGEVRIEAFDGTGREYGALEVRMAAGRALHVNSRDLEYGNARKGLRGGTGAGEGDWRVEVTSVLNLEVQGLIRSSGGLLQAVRGTTGRARPEGGMRYEAPLFHGGAHAGQESELRLSNDGGGEALVRVHAVDAAGVRSSREVAVALAAGTALRLRAADLEAAETGGPGAWRLVVESDREIGVLSLGVGSDGSLADLSRRGRPWGSARRTEVVDTTAETPDLWVTAAADRVVVSPGGRFGLRATVGNGGGGGSPPTTLRYHRSADSAVTPADTELGVDAVPALATGAEGTWTLGLTAPAGAGTHHYGACVDAVAGETDTANNCSAAAVIVRQPPGPPDLAVTAGLSAAVVMPGESFVLAAAVRNLGGEGAGSTTLRYHRSADAVVAPGDAELGTEGVPALAADALGRWTLGLTAPTGAGTHHYGACVDAVAGETETANNCSAVVLTVRRRPDPGNLAVTRVLVASEREETCPSSTTTRIGAVVTNAGPGPSAATVLRYYRSAEGTRSPDDEEVGAVAVPALVPSATWRHTLEIGVEAGTHHYYACVDGADGTDAADDCSPVVATTGEMLPPDIVAIQARIHGTATEIEVSPEALFLYGDTFFNDGDRSVPVALRIYRSDDETISTADTATNDWKRHGELRGQCYIVTGNHQIAPRQRGTYYWGTCAEIVEGESDRTNNCTHSVKVVVR